MALDPSVGLMVTEAYEETVAEALAQGQAAATAHREGISAAAMFLASMSGLEDAAARAEVEALGLKPGQ